MSAIRCQLRVIHVDFTLRRVFNKQPGDSAVADELQDSESDEAMMELEFAKLYRAPAELDA